LFYNPIIAVIVIVATFVKVIAIFLAAQIHKSRSSPLLTSGDAIPFGRVVQFFFFMLFIDAQHMPFVVSSGFLTKPQQWRKASSPIHWFVTMFM
jgi:hypothetical protein